MANGAFGISASYGTNFAMISDWAAGGAPHEQDIYYDDVEFSTGYTSAPPARSQAYRQRRRRR
jgi:hypothetical protein